MDIFCPEYKHSDIYITLASIMGEKCTAHKMYPSPSYYPPKSDLDNIDMADVQGV